MRESLKNLDAKKARQGTYREGDLEEILNEIERVSALNYKMKNKQTKEEKPFVKGKFVEPKDKKIMYRAGIAIDAPMKFKFIDRLRILFGARVIFSVDVLTQWKPGLYETTQTLAIDTLRSRFIRFFK